MICHHNGRVLGSRSLAVYFLACAFTSIAVILGISSSPASADTEHRKAKRTSHGSDTDRDGDDYHSHDGNGSRNRNIISVKSPVKNHGYQHTSSSTAGGATSIQNALCKHAKVCNITLKVIVINPDKAKKPKTKTATPKKASGCSQEEAETLAADEACDECCACRSAGSQE
jgi:hypothetical protein